MEDNKTIAIVFLKKESHCDSHTMITFILESQSQTMIILGKYLPISLMSGPNM